MADQALASPIEITTSNDTLSFNYDGGGANDITVPNGTYGSILTVIYALNNAIYNCGGGANNKVYVYLNSDYKVVIASRAAAFAIDWTDAPLMRMLGFRDDLAATGSYTATDTPRYLWLPPYYSADTDRFRRRPNISGGNAVDGTFSGISLAKDTRARSLRWEGVMSYDVYSEACESSYAYGGSTYYPQEERCLETLTIDALTASPTGTEGLSIKGCYYIEDMDSYDGFNAVTYVPNCPASMGGGGYRMHLDTSPDNYVFCSLVPGRWFDPTLPLENINLIYHVGLELIASIDGVPTWSKP